MAQYAAGAMRMMRDLRNQGDVTAIPAFVAYPESRGRNLTSVLAGSASRPIWWALLSVRFR